MDDRREATLGETEGAAGQRPHTLPPPLSPGYGQPGTQAEMKPTGPLSFKM
jgi:hypothetical protein